MGRVGVILQTDPDPVGSGMPHTHALVRRCLLSDTSLTLFGSPQPPFPVCIRLFLSLPAATFGSRYVSTFIYDDYFCAAISGW